ncbi:MAG: histidine kinase [Salinivirgaceae bacterium]|nr:histidine kinase [Salinivirgaceae bacterium]
MELITTYSTELLILTIVLFFIIILSLSASKRKKEEQIIKLTHEKNELVANQIKLEAGQLKSQLQPHTVNNILANLHSLSNRLNNGIESLSDTLEYILYSGSNHFTTIKLEIDFIHSYIKMYNLFVTEIDSMKIYTEWVDTNSPYYNIECLPHMITAYFIENAFKHGDKNHPDFLKISVKLSKNNFEFKVVNRIKNNSKQSKGGVGLENMRKRLELFHTNRFEIHHQKTEFEYSSTLTITFV